MYIPIYVCSTARFINLDMILIKFPWNAYNSILLYVLVLFIFYLRFKTYKLSFYKVTDSCNNSTTHLYSWFNSFAYQVQDDEMWKLSMGKRGTCGTYSYRVILLENLLITRKHNLFITYVSPIISHIFMYLLFLRRFVSHRNNMLQLIIYGSYLNWIYYYLTKIKFSHSVVQDIWFRVYER